jgi:DNA modification methylase
MRFITENIGSAQDNLKSPIHNWFKFTAGFSHLLVDGVISREKLKPSDAPIYDPFAGCGTTLVSCQKKSFKSVGNEGQRLMYDIIRAKLNWNLSQRKLEQNLSIIDTKVLTADRLSFKGNVHPLLPTLYEKEALKVLITIRDAIRNIKNPQYRLFFNLALSQTLHKVSIHPIAVPYISRNRTVQNVPQPWQQFLSIVQSMVEELSAVKSLPKTSKIFLHDSRKVNTFIEDDSCSLCLTSPPYLNNLDYGEVSKVHTHFFEITDDWADITKKVRSKLVTASTTHYLEGDVDVDTFKDSPLYKSGSRVAKLLLEKSCEIKRAATERTGRKSFDKLALLYFCDMYDVLAETRRVLKANGKAYLVLGDSAPYGVYVPTTSLLGEIGKALGFKSFEIHRIRVRGTKWKTLTHRHSLELPENVLILK